jgi:hypothetical protein
MCIGGKRRKSCSLRAFVGCGLVCFVSRLVGLRRSGKARKREKAKGRQSQYKAAASVSNLVKVHVKYDTWQAM